MSVGQRPSRMAIVGAGNIGTQHAEAYAAAGAHVIAICDVDRSRAEQLAAASGARPYTEVEEMLRAEQPEAMSVCTPPAGHAAPALAALRHHVPLLIEKPLADSLEAGRQIAAAAEATGTPVMVGFCHRFHEPVLQIKRLLDAGEIGEPVHFRNRFAYRFEGVERSWFSDQAVSGGGTLMDTSVHSIDLYRFLIGEIDRVAGEVETRNGAIRVEDDSVLLVNGPAGVPGVIEASWTTPEGESVLTIYGTEGNLGVDYEKGAFGVAFVHKAGQERRDLPREGRDRFTDEVRAFLDAIAEGREPSPGITDGVRALEVIAAVDSGLPLLP